MTNVAASNRVLHVTWNRHVIHVNRSKPYFRSHLDYLQRCNVLGRSPHYLEGEENCNECVVGIDLGTTNSAVAVR